MNLLTRIRNWWYLGDRAYRNYHRSISPTPIPPNYKPAVATPKIPDLRLTAAKAQRMIEERSNAIRAEMRSRLPEFIPLIDAEITKAAETGQDYICLSADYDTWLPYDAWDVVLAYYRSLGFKGCNNHSHLHLRWGIGAWDD